MENLNNENYKIPTPVQMQSIPVLLQNRDCVICSPTGSGKSCAFILPSIMNVHRNFSKYEKPCPLVLIITPTRELAMQLEEQIKLLVKGFYNYKTALIVGGEPIPSQIYRLKQGIQFIISTPGRLLDIIKQNPDISLSNICNLIIDEIDTLLKTGFESQINEILSLLPEEKQV